MHNISKKKIAVIGSGIAGISASYFLSSIPIGLYIIGKVYNANNKIIYSIFL